MNRMENEILKTEVLPADEAGIAKAAAPAGDAPKAVAENPGKAK